MANSFFSYKSLDSEMIEQLGFIWKPFDLSDNLGNTIDTGCVDGVPYTYFVNDRGNWSPTDDDLRIEGSFKFSNDLTNLFDTKKGVLGDNGTAGIACDWIAKQTSVRNTVLIESPIRKDSSLKEFNYSFVFPKGTLRGEVLFSFYFYVYSIDSTTPGLPSFIANEKGVRLGEFFSFTLFIDGNGSLFPVVDYDGNPGDPLWRMTLDFSDPLSETLSEKTCCLHINRTHKAYEDLMGKRQGGSDSFLFKEVMASAIQLLIEYSLSKDSELRKLIDTGESFDYGTIAYYISRFQNSLGIKTTSPPQTLAESLREYLEV